MVNLCCICKLEAGMVKDVSFHKIPKPSKPEEIRAKWILKIGREVRKDSRVCSRHFEEKFFIFKEIKGCKTRFLIADAVPSLLLCTDDKNDGSRISQNIINNSSLVKYITEEDKTASIKTVESQNVISNFAAVENTTDDTRAHCAENIDAISINISENITRSPQQNYLNKESTLKRSMDNPNSIRKRFCNHRYIGDLRREDFTSDASWKIVNNFIKSARKKRDTLKQKFKRLYKKMESLEALLKDLKKKGLLTSEGCSALEFSTSPALCEIIQNLLSSKKNNTYNPALKEFACTLMFYSTSAYNYVRNSFIKTLPHPQTIRKWYSKIDFSPGISQPVLDNIKHIVEANAVKGVRLQFGLQVDEMSMKKSIEWDGKKYHGCVDVGLNIEDSEEATYALVFMLVCLNAHFKTPIAYYLIRSLSAEVRANILEQILMVLHENNISTIRSITFDGASTNLSMVKHLGADMHTIENECFFVHSATQEPVVVVPDACHMLKLVRNTTSEYILMDDDDNYINWNFFDKLVKYQEDEKLHLGTKIRRRHIQYHKEKMKVKLAAQTLSASVSEALIFMELKFPKDFEGAGATAKYCKIMNNVFDFLNCRRKFGKSSIQSSINLDNYNEMEKSVTEFIAYISSLKMIEDKESGKTVSILKSKRRIGFWGLIVAMKSTLKLARYLLQNKLMDYILTYKLSQDHLETFFSCIRKRGGFNNNPTCRQFQSNYKKVVTHVNSIVPEEANCIKQDDTEILKFTNKIKNTNNDCSSDEIQNILIFDHNYIGANGWMWNEYNEEVIIYIAGYIVRILKRQLKCEMCVEQLEDDDTESLLIKIKNRIPSIPASNFNVKNTKKGLIRPSTDVVTICKAAEKVIRSTPKLFSTKNLLQKLMIQSKNILFSANVFCGLDMMPQEIINQSNHKLDLIDLILKKYFNIRLHHEGQCCQDNTQRIRNFHNRIVVFKNQ